MDNSNVFYDSTKYGSNILSKESILDILDRLNKELSNRGEVLDITIYGGSSLCLLTSFRDSTYDIDTLSSDNKLLKDCLISIGITGDLVNTDIDAFINKIEDLQVYKKYSNLTVNVPTLEYLVALKCRSARSKDLNDLRHLCKILDVKDLNDLKSIFIRYYSPIMFNDRRIRVLKEIFK